MIEFKIIKGQDYNRKIATISQSADIVGEEGRKEVVRIVNSLRNAVQRDLKKAKTGKVYDWRGINPGEKPDFFMGRIPAKKRSDEHRASAPGEAPAIDSGEMSSRLFIDPRKNEIEFGSLSENPPYPLWLEEGTKNMSARPWLEPVLKRFEPKIEKRLADIIAGRVKKDWRLKG
jgi:hypothetical protein